MHVPTVEKVAVCGKRHVRGEHVVVVGERHPLDIAQRCWVRRRRESDDVSGG